jgi:drug/metabolite transporter (DMT)-like permease
MTHYLASFYHEVSGTGEPRSSRSVQVIEKSLSGDRTTTIAAYPLLLSFSALVLAAVVWAGNAVVGRGLREAYDPLQLTFYRWSLASLCLYLVSGRAIRAEFCLARRNVYRLLTGAVCGMAGFHLLQYFALSRLPANEVAAAVGMTPVIVSVAQSLGRRAFPPPGITLGICIGMCGLYLVCYASQTGVHIPRPWAGIGAATAAMLCWCVYSMLLSQCEGMSWLSTLFYMALASTAILLPPYACDVITSGAHALTLKLFAQILYLGIPASVIAYALYNFGIQRVGALKATQFNCLIPAFASILAAIVLDEPMTKTRVFGLIFLTVGLILTSKKNLLMSGVGGSKRI